jgi:hypothetical protein
VKVVSDSIEESGEKRHAIFGMSRSLAASVDKMAEIRNLHRSGHGKASDAVGLEARHARLAVGTCVLSSNSYWIAWSMRAFSSLL